MATEKTAKLTRAGLFDILKGIVDATPDNVLATDKFSADVVRDKFNKEYANAHKTSKKSDKPSAAAMRNANDAHIFATRWNHNDVFGLKDITTILPERTHAQACVSIINVLMNKHLITKAAPSKDGRVRYTFKDAA